MKNGGKLAQTLALAVFGAGIPASLAAQMAAPIVPDAAVMRLDEVGLYAVGYRYRGGAEQRMPEGWSGYFDDRTGIACQPAGEQSGRHAFLLHCLWRGGTGVTFQEFTFRLPRTRRILLRGATAMGLDAVGKSDGATFRVYVNGRKQLDTNRTDASWQPFSFDLTPFAGQLVRIRFETDPGPKDNPSFDFSLWGDRKLVLEGYRPAVRPHPAPKPLQLSRISGVRNGVAPPDGFRGTRSVALVGDTVVFRYAGTDGTLEYRWKMPSDSGPLFGRIVLRARMAGDAPVEIPLATGASAEWTAQARQVESRWTPLSGGYTCVRTFRVGDQTAKLEIAGRMVGKSLTLTVRCDRPLIGSLYAGDWGPVMRRRQIPVPYYSGRIFYLPHENLFVNAILDWTASAASSHDQTRAQYAPLTDGSRRVLNERVVFTAGWQLPEVLPSIPNPPSPFLKALGGKIVLDVWGGAFHDIARQFETLADYGIRDCIALVHDWQRSGYDNALPAHVPANASLGGDPGMEDLVHTGTRLGYRVALHENYVDYYPNYEGFSESDIALDPQSKRVPAWYNPGTKIQSFAVKPNAILPLARTQSPEIHRRYGTNADYLDVHSAVPPWFHVDSRASEDGAATFRRVWDVHRELWRYERATHGGAVFGEGANHWYWSGCLDGVEAQFGVGWPGNQGLTAPLMVDFDVLRIHPLQFNHGMGYYERWWAKPTWGSIPPMVVLDQYRMQEVAYGHAGFLGAATWNALPLAWLEHHLMTPVTARYAAARPTAIAYQVGGKWVDSSEAAKAGRWDRVRIAYDNGLTVTANGAPESLAADGLTLPQYGWSAKGAGVTAWTAMRNGVVADYAETKNSIFANARNASHWNTTGVRRIRPAIAAFQQTGPRLFQATYRWSVGDQLERDYHCFVHFTAPGADPGDEAIRFQQDHPLARPTSMWSPGEVVRDGPFTIRLPDDLQDGDYGWTIGLFRQGGDRVNLEGEPDGHGRILLGTLHVRDSGRSVTFTRPPAARGTAAQYSVHLNERHTVVNFGPVRTNGSIHISREGSDWVLQTYPRADQFVVELSTERFTCPVRVRCAGGSQPIVHAVTAGRYWRLPLNGAREYRWKTDQTD